MVNKVFEMKNDYWEVEILKGTYTELEIKVSFKKEIIPESQLRKLERAIRLLLQACGRIDSNPSRR